VAGHNTRLCQHLLASEEKVTLGNALESSKIEGAGCKSGWRGQSVGLGSCGSAGHAEKVERWARLVPAWAAIRPARLAVAHAWKAAVHPGHICPTSSSSMFRASMQSLPSNAPQI